MRGDIFALKAPRDAREHEQKGRRFAVVVQSDNLPLSTLLVAPTSTSANPSSFRPEIELMGTRTLVQVEQTVAVAPSRLGDRVGRLTFTEMQDVNAALLAVLALD